MLIYTFYIFILEFSNLFKENWFCCCYFTFLRYIFKKIYILLRPQYFVTVLEIQTVLSIENNTTLKCQNFFGTPSVLKITFRMYFSEIFIILPKQKLNNLWCFEPKESLASREKTCDTLYIITILSPHNLFIVISIFGKV